MGASDLDPAWAGVVLRPVSARPEGPRPGRGVVVPADVDQPACAEGPGRARADAAVSRRLPGGVRGGVLGRGGRALRHVRLPRSHGAGVADRPQRERAAQVRGMRAHGGCAGPDAREEDRFLEADARGDAARGRDGGVLARAAGRGGAVGRRRGSDGGVRAVCEFLVPRCAGEAAYLAPRSASARLQALCLKPWKREGSCFQESLAGTIPAAGHRTPGAALPDPARGVRSTAQNRAGYPRTPGRSYAGAHWRGP